jgi:hypothetical protein
VDHSDRFSAGLKQVAGSQDHSAARDVHDKSPRRLEAENLFLRHQLSIALRRVPSRLRLRAAGISVLSTDPHSKQTYAARPGLSPEGAISATTSIARPHRLHRVSLGNSIVDPFKEQSHCAGWSPPREPR